MARYEAWCGLGDLSKQATPGGNKLTGVWYRRGSDERIQAHRAKDPDGVKAAKHAII